MCCGEGVEGWDVSLFVGRVGFYFAGEGFEDLFLFRCYVKNGIDVISCSFVGGGEM